MNQTDKLIFTLPIYNQDKKSFRIKHEEKFKKTFTITEDNKKDINDFRILFNRQNPPIHKFNDICGFAEIYWDAGVRILIDFYFNGNGRRKYNRFFKNLNPNKFYLRELNIQGGSFFTHSNLNEKKTAIINALKAIEAEAKTFNCYVNTEHEQNLLEFLDLEKYLQITHDYKSSL